MTDNNEMPRLIARLFEAFEVLRLPVAIACMVAGCGCMMPKPIVVTPEKRKPDTEIEQIVDAVLTEIAEDRVESQETVPPVAPVLRPDSGGAVPDSRPVVTVYIGDVRTCVPCRQFADWERQNRETAPFRFEIRTDVPQWLTGTPTFTFKGRDGQVRYAEPIGWRGIGPLVESYSTWGGGK